MKMDYRLTELLEQKSFEELTQEEKSFVLTHLSEAEYRRQHQLLTEVKTDLKEEAQSLKANDQIRINAIEALRVKNQVKKSGGLVLWFNYKIPLWSAVAALLLVFILTTPLLINTEIKDGKPNEQLAMQDTVYIEKIIKDTVEIKKPADTITKTVYVKNNESTVNKHMETHDFSAESNKLNKMGMEPVIAFEESYNPIDIGKRTSGKSLSEDPVGRVVLNISK